MKPTLSFKKAIYGLALALNLVEPNFSFKRSIFGLALLMGIYGAAKLFIGHDLHSGLWALAVCLSLSLSLLPRGVIDAKYPSRGHRPR